MRNETEANQAIELYSDLVKRLCFIHLKNKEDTEDIFQTGLKSEFKNAFNQMKASEELRDQTKMYLEQARQKDADTHIPLKRYIFGACCSLAMLCIIIFGVQIYQSPVSYISVDVNPSVEMTLNRFDRVVAAKAYNKDGKKFWKMYP